jgi:transcriptional regulator with XRE-family HTH domain
MGTPETFAQRLQRIRQRSGLSQPRLAEAAGLAVASVRNYEQGRRMPGLEEAAKMARALGCTLDELAGPLGGPEPPAEKPGKPRKKK